MKSTLAQITLILLITTLLNCSNIEVVKNKNNDLAIYNYKGAVKEVLFMPDKTRISFNKDGYITAYSIEDWKTEYTRDANNRITEIDGQPLAVEYTYDNLNRLIITGDTIADDLGCRYFTMYQYNEAGQYTKIGWVSGFERGTTEYEYDNEGNCTVENVNEIEGYSRKYTKFNKYGDPTEYITTVNDTIGDTIKTTTTTIKYEYDKQANWTKQTSNSDEGTEIVTREITYY